jgi:hypothetical protein
MISEGTTNQPTSRPTACTDVVCIPVLLHPFLYSSRLGFEQALIRDRKTDIVNLYHQQARESEQDCKAAFSVTIYQIAPSPDFEG